MNSSRVWLRFEKTLKDGTVKKFKVQQVPTCLYANVIEFMYINFLPEEPFSYAANLLSDPKNLEHIKRYWRENILSKNFSVVCLEDDESADQNKEIVGVNFLFPFGKTDTENNKPGSIAEPPGILKLLNEVASRFDVFEAFGVDRILTACGLAVSKKYRGLNIGKELLLARTPICKENGITLTETVFTAVGSQKVAAKTGFTTAFEIDFSDLAEKLNVRFPEGFKTLKVMTKVIE